MTVTDPDVGQGWCQATGPSGTVGVVPEVIIMWMFDRYVVRGVGCLVVAQLDLLVFGCDLHWFIIS